MPYSAVNAVINLETLYWMPQSLEVPDGAVPDGEGVVNLWPVYFKIDGSTTQVDAGGQLTGTATVSGTSGVGAVGNLQPGESVLIPPDIGVWTGEVEPIPVAASFAPAGTSAAGVFGAAVVVLQPGALEADALIAGHESLNEQVQKALNTLISTLSVLEPNPSPRELDTLTSEVMAAVKSAIHGAMDVWDKINYYLNAGWFGSTLCYYGQDELPTGSFDQLDFDPQSSSGPALMQIPMGFSWDSTQYPGIAQLGLSGAISQSQRAVSQAVVGHVDAAPPGFLAGAAVDAYFDGAIHHVLVASKPAVVGWCVSEIWWPRPLPTLAGSSPRQLGLFTTSITDVAGWYSADGFQNAVVGTADGALTYLWWGPSSGESVNRARLYQCSAYPVALAGFATVDGVNHVIVVTGDGNLTELYWPGELYGAVENRLLMTVDSPVRDVAGYGTPDDGRHVIVLTGDGKVTHLDLSGSPLPWPTGYGELAQVEAQLWNNPLGVGAFGPPRQPPVQTGSTQPADDEHHAIISMSNGTLRELHWTPGGTVFHDDLGSIYGAEVPRLGAYTDTAGYQHAVRASVFGDIHELSWKPTRPLPVANQASS